MEHKFIELAKEQFRNCLPMITLRRQVHNKETARDQSGMICSGEQTILLLSLQQADKPSIERLIEQRENGCLEFSPEGMRVIGHPPDTAFHFQWTSEGDWLYRQKTGYLNRLFIIGAGHVALAFSRLMQTLDFHITLFDERPGLDSFQRNEYVHEKRLIADYSRLNEHVGGGQENYVVVMTQGYRTDDLAIRALIGEEFKYFGVLGSKAKIERLFDAYRAEGIHEKKLQKLWAPAGLPICSQTPEEIAVSIAAEIIRQQHISREE